MVMQGILDIDRRDREEVAFAKAWRATTEGEILRHASARGSDCIVVTILTSVTSTHLEMDRLIATRAEALSGKVAPASYYAAVAEAPALPKVRVFHVRSNGRCKWRELSIGTMGAN